MSLYTLADFNTVATSYTQLNNVPFHSMVHAFNLMNHDLLDAARQSKKRIKKNNLDSFEKRTGISFEQFFNKEINASLLKKRLQGDTLYLPEKYSHACFSRIRTSANIIEYMRFMKGWEYVDKLLAKHQMHSSYIDDLDREINFLFFRDVFDEVSQGKINHELFRTLAYSSILKNEETWLGQLFSSTANDEELFSIFSKYSSSYDTNFIYNVEIKHKIVSIRITENPLVHDLLKKKILGNRALCTYKQHFFSMLPLHRGGKILDLKEVSCLYHGHSECQYDLQLTPSLLKVI